jgi:hypothetical protein
MYYIYENYTAEKKVVIHKGECNYCNNGKGTGRNTEGDKNGRWHGGYSTYEEAKAKSKLFIDRKYKECGHCMK